MRTLSKNKRKLYYALLIGEGPTYVYDENGNKIVDYVDEDGNEYYRETGEPQKLYSKPVEFLGNISMSGGETQAQEFGVDIGQYDAVLVLNKDEIPISETSLVWFESEVRFKDAENTVIEPKSADYKVLAIKSSLNQFKAILGRITK